MLFQLDFSGLKSTTENQRKSNIGKPLENSMVWSVLQESLEGVFVKERLKISLLYAKNIFTQHEKIGYIGH